MVFMPPQHGKSSLISMYFPVWYLLQHPDKHILLASYEASMAEYWAGKARDIVREHGNTVGVQINPRAQSASWWQLAGHEGYMAASGVGGPITGKGAHIAIIDDPVKNAAEAASSVYQERAWGWFRSTLYSRLAPDGAIILGMTRWDEDELAGWLLRDMASGGEQWDVLSLPAIAEEGDALGRVLGEALWPERYNLETLEQIRDTIGPYYWQALYQQRPTPPEGGLIKREWFRYFSEHDDVYELPGGPVKTSTCRRYVTVDLAFSERKGADYTVLCSWVLTPKDDLLLVDVIRVRLEDELMAVSEGKGLDDVGLMRLLWQVWEEFKPAWIGVEKTAIKSSLLTYARRRGLPIRDLVADKDKVTRAQSAIAKMSAGGVYFRQGAAWLKTFENELLSFPHGAHDDQVDCMSYAVSESLSMWPRERPQPIPYRMGR